MDNGAKYVVVAKDGQALIGSHFHTLEDKSCNEFVTESINDLATYIKDTAGKVVIFYDDDVVTAMPEMCALPQTESRYLRPVAVCNLLKTSYFKQLKNALGKDMGIVEFERFMTVFRNNAGTDGKALLDNIRDFRVSKVVSVDRKKDNRGNVVFGYRRESAGTDDFQPPEKIKFFIPVYEHIDDKGFFGCDFIFDYKEVGDSVQLVFRLENLNWEDEAAKACEGIIKDALAKIEVPKYRGKVVLHEATDAWKYKSNAP
jgi:hypothetical protein